MTCYKIRNVFYYMHNYNKLTNKPYIPPVLVLHPKIGFSPGQHCRSNVLEMIVCGQVKRKQSRDL